MIWISLKRRPALFLYSSLFLLLIETVSSDGVQHIKLNTNTGRHVAVEGLPSITTPSSSENHQHHHHHASTSSNSNHVKETGCSENWCSKFSDIELLELDAIRQLHRQIDDDQNGSIDIDESDEFLREELAYEGDYEKRQKLFHQNDDNHISVKELWELWISSEVHNWTTDQTIDWLKNSVGLPQYEPIFLLRAINGTFLPRLAINQYQVLSSMVGIKDPINKQKLALKAQDVVLFGYPQAGFPPHYLSSILTTLLVLALSVCWFVYSRYKLSKTELSKMIKDMESLAKAEQCLLDLQKELEKARNEQMEKAEEEAGFHKKLLDDSIPCSEEITRLKGEVEVLRNELQRAEVELQDKCWVPPPALQHWLQLTYELELKSYNRKKQGAEKQLKQAKDACDKLKKKRSSLMGAFVSTHGRSIDDVDKAILEARTSLTEITQELQERMHRWKQIEILVNCPIMNNPGLPYLETILRGIGRGSTYNGPGSVISNSQDDIDDDGASSIYAPSAVSCPGGSSGSAMVHLPISRSKSVSSMLSLRERAVSSRDCSSKESSTGEDDETNTNGNRRVTFGIHTSDHQRYFIRKCASTTSSFVEQRELISTQQLSITSQPRQWKKEENEKGGSEKEREEEPNLIKGKKIEDVVVVSNEEEIGKENVKIWKLISRSLRRPNSNNNNNINNKSKFGLESQQHSAVLIPDELNKKSSWRSHQVLRLRPWKISHAAK